MNKSITVMLVDDQQLMVDGLKMLLEMEPDISVIAQCNNGADAIRLFEKVQPDVVMMDVRMPVLDGVETTKQICQRWPDARIIILTTFDDDQFIFDGVRAGAVGYLLKAISGSELAAAVRTVASGGALMEPSVARRIMAKFSNLPSSDIQTTELLDPLTFREEQVLQLVAIGLTNKEIANRLYLAEGTVKNYLSNVLQKLNVRDRTQAAIRARDLGLL